ncbi:Glutathione S-transferase YfcF [Thalassocella blandensis]|nr:Glutathione S-transferase YfcF [Thalassocella blandensis]
MFELVLGNKNYSTWSLRPWLLLKHFNIPFHEHHVSLNAEDLSLELSKFSPSCKVPVLIDDHIHVWDSLAICEYVNEFYLENQAWPNDKSKNAHARGVANEMHSSFGALRQEMPMNIRAKRIVQASEACNKDIARIDAIWSECVNQYNGPWLFGQYSIADCMFAPVVMRFATYGVELSNSARRYYDNVLEDAHLKQWIDAANAETEIVMVDEAGVEA